METAEINYFQKTNDNMKKDCESKNQVAVLPKELQKSITKIAENEGLISYKIEWRAVTTSGGNYLGDLYEAVIKGKTKKGDIVLNLFIKNIMPGVTNLTSLSLNDFYSTEIFAYTELYRVIAELQDEWKIPDHEKFTMVKYYDTGITSAIIMENMVKKGYKVFDRMKIISLELAEMAITKLAKFHALSYIMKKERHQFYETKINTRKIPFEFNDEMSDLLNNSFKQAIEVLTSDSAKTKIRLFSNGVFEKYKSFYDEDKTNITILCHGDYRNNNMLILEEEGVLKDLIPVDYQLLYCGNPINDFLYFIFGATDYKFRKNHFEHLKNVYYDHLKDYLGYFNCDVEEFYSRKMFENDINDRMAYGLIVGVWILPFILAPEDDVPDVCKESLADMKIRTTDLYVERINDLVQYFIDMEIL